MRPGKRKKLDKANNLIKAMIDKVEKRQRTSAPRWSPTFRVVKLGLSI